MDRTREQIAESNPFYILLGDFLISFETDFLTTILYCAIML